MSSLLSMTDGGVNSSTDEGTVQSNSAGTKRMRTTRAALSALEGGERSVKRKDRWFRGELNPFLVEKTGGRGWTELALQQLADTNPAPEEEMKMAGTGSVSEAEGSEVSVPWEATQQQQQVVSDVVPVRQAEVEVLLKQKPKRGRPRKNMAKVVVEGDEKKADQSGEMAGPLVGAEAGGGAGVGDGKQGVNEVVSEVAGEATNQHQADADRDGDVSMTQ